MNYKFPNLNNISDVLPHVEGLNEFLVIKKDWYTVINYAVVFEETFKWNSNDYVGSTIRRECRGLIFDTKSGNILSRPYHKFFNIGEKDETQLNKINLYEPHVVLEKLDGSMVRPIPTPEGFHLATKAGITDVAMNAEVFIADKPEYSGFIHAMFDGGMSPLFEWCSRKNRIVVDYPEDQLILTGVRNNVKGVYLPYFNIVELAEHWNIPVVQAVDGLAVQNIDLFVKQVREWDDGEGIVLRFDTGHMVKVKADDYVLRHKTKSAINHEKNVIQIILNDDIDDIIPILSDSDAKRLLDFKTAFWMSVDDLCIEMASLFIKGNTIYPEKKDFATKYVQACVDEIYWTIMYQLKSGKSSKEVIINMIEKSLTSQKKINENRWLWGNLDWNYSNN